MAVKKYGLEQLYVGTFKEKNRIAYYDDISKMYINFSILNRSEEYDKRFDEEFVVDKPLSEALEKENLTILLTDSNGNRKKELSFFEINDILIAISRKKILSSSTLGKQAVIAKNITDLVSDMLGLNSENNPSTSPIFLRNFDISYSIVPAKKLKEFKQNLYEYISISLMTETNVIVRFGNGLIDYKILRSLNKARIKQTDKMKQNSFLINIGNDGKILINGIDINEYNKKQNTGFQKTIKF